MFIQTHYLLRIQFITLSDNSYFLSESTTTLYSCNASFNCSSSSRLLMSKYTSSRLIACFPFFFSFCWLFYWMLLAMLLFSLFAGFFGLLLGFWMFWDLARYLSSSDLKKSEEWLEVVWLVMILELFMKNPYSKLTVKTIIIKLKRFLNFS